jgi:hypothetical protein
MNNICIDSIQCPSMFWHKPFCIRINSLWFAIAIPQTAYQYLCLSRKEQRKAFPVKKYTPSHRVTQRLPLHMETSYKLVLGQVMCYWTKGARTTYCSLFLTLAFKFKMFIQGLSLVTPSSSSFSLPTIPFFPCWSFPFHYYQYLQWT